MTKKRRRPIHLHVMVSEAEQALIQERMAESGIASLIRRYTRFNQQAGAIQKLNFDGLQIDLENRSATTSNGTFELPPKEFDLLLYCAKHQGKILTKQQIYEEVWGEEYFYDDSNIMAIISRLRKKLEVNPSSPKYIQTVKGIGYRFNKEV